jgi:hypothetical protein
MRPAEQSVAPQRIVWARAEAVMRRALQFTVVVSFLLSLAVHLFWLRSYLCTEKVVWAGQSGWRSARTASGHFEFSLHVADWSSHPADQFHGPRYVRGEVLPPYFHMWDLLCSSMDDIDIDWQWGGFAWNAKLNFVQGDHYSTTIVPCWLLGVLTLIVPALSAARHFRRSSTRA